MIHTAKGFHIVNVAEVDVCLKFSCFFYDPMDVDNLTCGSSAFSKSNLNICNFSLYVLLKPTLQDFDHYFASMCNKHKCVVILLHCSSFGLE